jgi:SAM-dependent methyltransferase
MDRSLVRFYRTAEDFRRYSPGSLGRTAELRLVVRRHRRLFGRTILDLACGGGLLGTVLDGTVTRYVGIDANPDMIREARAPPSKGSTCRVFVLGDITRKRIDGRFDTLTLLGNALGHLTAEEMDRLLVRRRENVHAGSNFLIEYRDVVAMFWDRAWTKVYVQNHKRGRVVARTERVDFCGGQVHITARPRSGGWKVAYTQAIWSPFILDSVMRNHGWRPVSQASRVSVPGGSIGGASKLDPYLRFGAYHYSGS